MKITWLTPYGPEKLWDPALRLRRWNVHQEFLKLGIDSQFVWNMADYSYGELLEKTSSSSVVVFTEQSELEFLLMKELRGKGVFVVRDHCENIFGFPWEKETFGVANMVVCCSEALSSATVMNGFKEPSGLCVIPDMWESVPLATIKDSSENLTALFMGTGLSLKLVTEQLSHVVRQAGYNLVIISNEQGVGIPWKEDTWRDIYKTADVILCPQVPAAYPCKSNVKVAQAMGGGYPVIASRLDSYVTALGNGSFGILAEMVEDWYKALVQLKDPSVRSGFAAKALVESVKYSPEAIARKWYATFIGKGTK